MPRIPFGHRFLFRVYFIFLAPFFLHAGKIVACKILYKILKFQVRSLSICAATANIRLSMALYALTITSPQPAKTPCLRLR
jgi:hypothetical protein